MGKQKWKENGYQIHNCIFCIYQQAVFRQPVFCAQIKIYGQYFCYTKNSRIKQLLWSLK